MADFKPNFPYNTAIALYIPTGYKNVKGVRKAVYPDEGIRLNCSFRTFGGTETTVNGIYSIVNTATVETWYRPDITSDCRIEILATGEMYEIISTPENIGMRNQFCQFKVKAVEGGA